MSIEQKKRLIESLDGLIHRKTPGDANQLSEKLGISRRTFFRVLDYMRAELNAPVVFDEINKRYIYENEGMIIFGFVSIEELKLKRFTGS
jgi:hypothetical protein